MKTKKEFILSIIENMNEEEINFMDNLFSEEVYYDTRKILELFAPEIDQKRSILPTLVIMQDVLQMFIQILETD